MKIWVDIDNAPHVLVLYPLIRWLEAAGHTVDITARRFGQTLPLLDLYGLEYRAVSRHAGGNPLGKVAELALRSARLFAAARHAGYDLALCHGARGIVAPARALGLPLVYLTDYEHGSNQLFRWSAARTLVPDVIPDAELARIGFDLARVRKFPGLKEDLYVYDFEPDPAEVEALGLDLSRPLVLVRPPATTAHYHADASEALFAATLDLLRGRRDAQVLVLPRTERQERELRRELAGEENFVFPRRVAAGPNLLWHADLVIGGGGTMNREAACLGVPVYSIFRGRIGAVDRHLAREGRLVLVEEAAAVRGIPVEKRERRPLVELRRRSAELRAWVGRAILEAAA